MALLPEPQALAELTEIDPELPSGAGDRFSGYGVMGVTFTSGHVLALRRFPASSLGYGYSAVWYRDPKGRWTFWSDVSPQASCARFFGEAIDEVLRAPIDLRWDGARSLHVTVGAEVDWYISLRATPVTMAMNLGMRLLPDRLWRHPRVLRALGWIAGRVLKLGQVGLVGRVPNGQQFLANPYRIWRVTDSRAVVRGIPLGPIGPLATQAMLGDFAIPQQGIFSLGRAHFETFDPTRHSPAVVRRPPPARENQGGGLRNVAARSGLPHAS